MLAHPVNIRYHHPVVSIDEEFHEPTRYFIWINFTKEHDISKNHQPFDVMGIGMLNQPVDHDVYWIEACGPGVEGFGEFPFVLKKIGCPLLFSIQEIDCPHELPPSDDLSD